MSGSYVYPGEAALSGGRSASQDGMAIDERRFHETVRGGRRGRILYYRFDHGDVVRVE